MTRLQPEYGLVWRNLGATYLNQGKDAQAVQALRTGLRLDPLFRGEEIRRRLAQIVAAEPPTGRRQVR